MLKSDMPMLLGKHAQTWLSDMVFRHLLLAKPQDEQLGSTFIYEEKRHALLPYRWAVLTAALLLSAQGGIPCAPRHVILKALHDNYKEMPVNRGLAVNGMVFEVAANATGTWSAFFTRPDGISCLVLSGEAWQSIEPKPPADPEVSQ